MNTTGGSFGAVTYKQYAMAGKDFFDLLPTSTEEQADNGLKALGLLYLGLDETQLDMLQKINAPRLLEMATKHYFDHIVQLEMQCSSN